MTEPKIKTVTMPPFPELTWDEFKWTATIKLASWAGAQDRRGPYGSVSSSKPSDGTTELSIDSADVDEQEPPTTEQIAAFKYLATNEEKITNAILDKLFEDWSAIRAEWLPLLGYDSEMEEAEDDEEREDIQAEYDQILPDAKVPDDLKAVIGLHCVHIQTICKEGFAYVGFEFGCTWETEHGYGVLIHKDRVVDTGHASVSFDGVPFEEDYDDMPEPMTPEERRAEIARLMARRDESD